MDRRAIGAHARRQRRRDSSLRRPRPDRGREAARPGPRRRRGPRQLALGPETDPAPAAGDRGPGRRARALQRVGHYGAARGALHRDPVSDLGGDEGVAAAGHGRRVRVGSGECGVWERGGGGGGGGDDAAGCREDEDDVGERESGGVGYGGEGVEGEWSEGICEWDWA